MKREDAFLSFYLVLPRVRKYLNQRGLKFILNRVFLELFFSIQCVYTLEALPPFSEGGGNSLVLLS
jgi:hypothetical protein